MIIRKEISNRICNNCGVDYTSHIKSQVYCSKRCRTLFDIKKHKVDKNERSCKQCGNIFIGVGNYQKYCSEKCRYNYWVLTNEKRTCGYCSREFDACQKNKKYCSVECRSANWDINPKKNDRDKKRQLEYSKARRKSSVVEKLKYRISDRIRKNLRKKNFKKGKKTIEIIGCTIHELKAHLESKFQQGMTWENHSIDGWHIDHKKPLCTAKTEADVYELWHYTNLQPLWSIDNIKKGGRYA